MIIEITKTDAILSFVIFVVVVIVLVFGGDIVSFNAVINGVPSDILIGTPDENMAIISGYLDGCLDAKTGRELNGVFIPESYCYGYCHGYADYSGMDLSIVYNLNYKIFVKEAIENKGDEKEND